MDTLVFEQFDLAELEEDPTPRDLSLRSFWIELDLGEGQIERRMLRDVTYPASGFPEDGPGTRNWDRFLQKVKENVAYGWFGGELVDIDRDGLLDLVWGNLGPDPNYRPVFWSKSDQGVIASPASFVADEGHGGSYFRDIDQDGDLDALWGYGISMELVVMVNHDGEFTQEGTLSFDWEYPRDVGDIDGDGLFDGLVGIQDGLPSWFDALTGELHVQGDVPAPRPRSSTVFLKHSLQAPSGSLRQMGDFNGDGHLDFLALNYAGGNDLVWLADTNHDLTYDEVTPIPDGRSSYSEPVLIVDIDLDGDVDLVMTETFRAVDGYSLIVFKNTDGLGTFRRDSSVRLIVSQRSPEQLLVGDIDRDGDQDIVTVDRRRRDVELQVHMNVDGKYETQSVDTWLSRDTTPVIMTDFDLDGDLDLVTSGNPAAGWFEYDDGRFGDRTRLGVVPIDGRLQVDDMDADGDLDLVVADGTAVRIWRNEDGDYVEGQHVAYERTGEVETGDIDDDGDLDVAVHSRNTIEWFESRGGNLVGPLIVDQTLTNFSNTEFVDLDLDGDLDVVERKRPDQWTWHETRLIGDVNDDGIFSSSDLVTVFQAGRYEDGVDDNATFEQGDWNQDGDFDSGDFVIAFQTGHYELEARPLAAGIAAAVDWLFDQDDDAKKSRAFVA